MQGYQWAMVRNQQINSILRIGGIVVKGLGHLFSTSSSYRFFNKTDLEEYLVDIVFKARFC